VAKVKADLSLFVIKPHAMKTYNALKKFNVAFRLRFKVLTVMSMKMDVFWEVALYSLVDIDRRFRGAYCLFHQDYESLRVMELQGATSQKTAIFILVAVRT
jgi:hypothetical protein